MSFNRRVLLSTALLLTVLSINDRPTIRQRKRRLSAIKRLILVWLLSGVVAGCATAPPVVHQPETSPLSGEYQASAFRDRGKAWSAQGDYDRAIADFNKAIEIYPEYAEALVNRGIASRAKGEYDRAIQDYDQAIRLEPDYAEAFNNRAIQDYGQA